MFNNFRGASWTRAWALLTLLGMLARVEAGPLILRIDDGINFGVVLSSSSGGPITFSGVISTFSVDVSARTTLSTMPLSGYTNGTYDPSTDSYYDAIGLDYLHVSTTTGGTLRLILAQADFDDAPNGSVHVKNQAEFAVAAVGGSLTFKSSANPGDFLPDLGSPEGPPADFLPNVSNLPPAGTSQMTFTFLGSGVSATGGSFAMNKFGQHSLFSTITFSSAGEGKAELIPAGAVPEPGSLLVMATGSLSWLTVASVRRRRRRR